MKNYNPKDTGLDKGGWTNYNYIVLHEFFDFREKEVDQPSMLPL